MKYLIKYNYLFISALIAFSSCSNPAPTEETTEETQETTMDDGIVRTVSHSIDPEASTIHWKGEMLGMYSHEGNVDLRESYISMENGELAGGGFIVDMTTITPTDENYKPSEGKTKEKLVGHLSSPDFFNVAEHPKASFDIIEVMDGKLKGFLTIRDNKHEEIVENVVVEKMGDKYHLSGTLTFDRKKYDVAFDHPVQEMVISDDIALNLDLTTVAPPAE